MKRVFELIDLYSREQLWSAQITLYPSHAKNKPVYLSVFDKIPELVPTLNDRQLITQEISTENIADNLVDAKMRLNFWAAPDVFIMNKSTPAPTSPHCSLPFMRWSKALGVNSPRCSQQPVWRCGHLAHCLFAMIFDG